MNESNVPINGIFKTSENRFRHIFLPEEKQNVAKVSPTFLPNHNRITSVLEKDLKNIKINQNLIDIFEDMVDRITRKHNKRQAGGQLRKKETKPEKVKPKKIRKDIKKIGNKLALKSPLNWIYVK